MDKYKINYIFGSQKDINDIFIEVLTREIKKYFDDICSNNKESVCGLSSLNGDKKW